MAGRELALSCKKLKPLRVALLGLGAVAELYYAPALKELEKDGTYCVAALYDPNPQRLVVLSRLFPASTTIKDLSELAKLGIDLAIVASPPRYHSEQSIQALSYGIAVLCEKPMATSLKDAQAMLEAAERNKCILAVGLFRRFFPAAQLIQHIISSKALGPVQHFRLQEGGRFTWQAASPALFQASEAAGGVLLDIGVHALDLLCWWLGEPAELSYEDDAAGGIEANCQLTMRFPSNIAGTIRLSRECPLHNQYYVSCEKGWLSWQVGQANNLKIGFHNTNQLLDGKVSAVPAKTLLPISFLPTANYQQSFLQQLHNVAAAIVDNKDLTVSGAEAMKSLKLIEHCYQNRKSMNMPWLTAQEQERVKELRELARRK